MTVTTERLLELLTQTLRLAGHPAAPAGVVKRAQEDAAIIQELIEWRVRDEMPF